MLREPLPEHLLGATSCVVVQCAGIVQCNRLCQSGVCGISCSTPRGCRGSNSSAVFGPGAGHPLVSGVWRILLVRQSLRPLAVGFAQLNRVWPANRIPPPQVTTLKNNRLRVERRSLLVRARRGRAMCTTHDVQHIVPHRAQWALMHCAAVWYRWDVPSQQQGVAAVGSRKK
jgi:hypothetical protein